MCLHLIVHTGTELHGQDYGYQGGENWESQPLDLNDLPGVGVLPLLSPDKSQPTLATMNEILLVKPNRNRNSVQAERGHTWSLTPAWWWWGLSWRPDSVSWHVFAFCNRLSHKIKGQKCPTENQNPSSLLSTRPIILSKKRKLGLGCFDFFLIDSWLPFLVTSFPCRHLPLFIWSFILGFKLTWFQGYSFSVFSKNRHFLHTFLNLLYLTWLFLMTTFQGSEIAYLFPKPNTADVRRSCWF